MTDPDNVSFRAPLDAAGRMRVGQVLEGTYRTFRLAPGRLIGIGLLPLVLSGVSVVPGLFQDPNRHDPTTAFAVGIVSFLLTIVQYVAQIATQGASIYAGGRLLAGSNFTMGEALDVGLRRFWPMLGLWILIGLIIVTGLVLLVIPGLIATCVLAVALQACILEGRGPIESIKRSAALTKGNRWRVLGAYLLTFLPIMAAFAITITLALGLFAAFRDAPLALMIGVGAIVVLVLVVVTFVSVGIAGAFLAVLFVELRQAKEGTGAPGGVAGVFD